MDLELVSARQNSPLEVIIQIAPYAATGLAASRGLVYLMSKWEDWRVKRAASSYQVAALQLLKESLPTIKSSPDLYEERLIQAANIVPLIDRVAIDSAGSASDGQ